MADENSKIKIFLVDDHEIVIDGLFQLLGDVPGFELLGRASNGVELLEKLDKTVPDVILMDIRMPEMDGFSAIEKVKANYPDIKVLFLSMFNTRKYIKMATDKGADGYISKTKGKKDFIDGIRRVYNGEFVIIVDLDNDTLNADFEEKKKPATLDELSEREKQIICLISKEFTTAEIAKLLFRSPHTIERHRKNIMNKLQVKNVAGIVRVATEFKLCQGVQLPDNVDQAN